MMEQEKRADVSQRLEKYGFGLKTSGFVSFLAWTGMMFGILGILFSLELFILPSELWPPGLLVPDLYLPFYTAGIVGILASTTWLGLSVALRMRNAKKDYGGVRQILKIKSYITGSFEIILSILGFILNILLLTFLTFTWNSLFEGLEVELGFSERFLNWFFDWFGLIIPICGLCFLVYLVFASFKIQGVQKANNSFLNSYIIFNMGNFVLCVALGMSAVIYFCQNIDPLKGPWAPFGTPWILLVFGVIVISFAFIYTIGPLVVLYNLNHHLDSKFYNENLNLIAQPYSSLKGKDGMQSVI